MWDSLIVTPFVNVLLFIYSLIGNLGVAIILFTILIRLLTHPLTVQQLKRHHRHAGASNRSAVERGASQI